jgi:predicted transcriptional regulator
VEERAHIERTSDEDRATESAVLQHVLALHPSPVAVEDLTREIGAGEASFDQRDAVDRAVRDLAAAGLLHRNDSIVLPSRAALRFDELLGE